MNISPNFSISEVFGDHEPNQAAFTIENAFNACKLAYTVLEPWRDILRRPIGVTSWFRCDAYNRVIGGEKDSEHLTGGAVDVLVTTRLLEAFLALSPLPFGQRIIYYKNPGDPLWVHVGIRRPTLTGNRHLVCVIAKDGTKRYYPTTDGRFPAEAKVV